MSDLENQTNERHDRKQEQQIHICLVFKMQLILKQVRLGQMLMNTVVTCRPAREVMCAEVLQHSRSLPVYLHLATYLLSSP